MLLRRCNVCRVRVIPTSGATCPQCGGPIDTSEFAPVEAVRKPAPPPPRRGPAPWYLPVSAWLLCLISLANFWHCSVLTMRDERPARPVVQDPNLAKVAAYFWKVQDFVSTAPAMVMYLLGLLGAVCMLLRRGWLLSFFSTLIAMLPLTGIFCLGMPIGMLSLIVLMLPQVRLQFRLAD